MEFYFKNKNLAELYEKGISKKYKLPDTIIKKFMRAVAIFEAAQNIYDIWKAPSLHFEKLQGKRNAYSTRLSKKWRLEIEIEWENEEKTTGTVIITEISSHYGD